MYGIWCKDANDWLRELPSKVDDGGKAVLAFESYAEASKRGAKNYGLAQGTTAEKRAWYVVRLLKDGPVPAVHEVG